MIGKIGETLHRCFFSSPRTLNICRPGGDRKTRDVASSSRRILLFLFANLLCPISALARISTELFVPNLRGFSGGFLQNHPIKKLSEPLEISQLSSGGGRCSHCGDTRIHTHAHHIPIFSRSADVSIIGFAAVSCDRRTNDSNLIKSASTQNCAVRSLETVFHL